jgi:hypothetical protein
MVAAGAAGELDGLRAAGRAAIRAVAGGGRPIVVLGAGPVSLVYGSTSRGTLAAFGVDLEVILGGAGGSSSADRAEGVGPPALPVALTIGAWLVNDAVGDANRAIGYSVGPDWAGSLAAADVLARTSTGEAALVVLGDGSARRSTSAPGYLDERAAGFDQTVATALRDGDAAALANLDLDLGQQLLAGGVAVWRAAGQLLAGGDYAGDLRYDDAPYGVGYFVATWIARG